MILTAFFKSYKTVKKKKKIKHTPYVIDSWDWDLKKNELLISIIKLKKKDKNCKIEN